jgi:pimeloyl-ACP methyl ester carboxylesterase
MEATTIDPRIVAGSDYGASDREWTRIDWREHLARVELPGASVNYVELGEGEPLLFIHGISGCWQNWLENLPHFAAAGRRCVALDLPGFGASPMPSWPIGMAAYGQLLRDFCEKLGLGGATLVGNSMGGLLATELALAEPAAFQRLVLVSAAGIINTWRPEERAVATAWAWRRFAPLFADRGGRSSPGPGCGESSSGRSSVSRTDSTTTSWSSRSSTGCTRRTGSSRRSPT